MKIFISWSGESSKAIAVEIREWFRLILADAEPFISVSDIEAGERWLDVVGKHLEATTLAKQGHVNESGKAFNPKSVAVMLTV